MLSIGDLANALTLRFQQTQTKNRVAVHSRELATGVTEDPAARLNGNIGQITALQADLSTLTSYRNSTTEASLLADATQSVLDDIQSSTSDLGAAFLKVDLASNGDTRNVLATEASEVFSLMIDRLNGAQAGRALFAGNATDFAALASDSTILMDLRSVVMGAATATDAQNRINNWFDTPGGGFETAGYLGSNTDQQPFLLNDTEDVAFSIRADNSVLRDLLKHAATAALAVDPALGFSATTQASLMRQAGDGLITTQGALTSLRAEVGSAQGRIADAQDRNDAHYAALSMSLSDLLSVDGFEAATNLENNQTQLETIYAISARQSRMRLVDYLR